MANRRPHPRNSIRFKHIATCALGRSHDLVANLLPDGRLEGAEWVSRNPTRNDRHPGSFKINTSTGVWADFATGDGGSDLISLFAYLTRSSQSKAALFLAERLGIDPHTHSVNSTKLGPRFPANYPNDNRLKWINVLPPNRQPPPDRHASLCAPSAIWTYRAACGNRSFFVYRFDNADRRKEFRPRTLWMDPCTGRPMWRWLAPPNPRPIYRLNEIKSFPTRSILICEGEKAADAAHKLSADHVVTTSMGGAKASHKSDWTVLARRHIAIWPDADEAGLSYANSLHGLLSNAGAASVSILKPPQGVKSGWDAADALAEGWTAEEIGHLIEWGGKS